MQTDRLYILRHKCERNGYKWIEAVGVFALDPQAAMSVLQQRYDGATRELISVTGVEKPPDREVVNLTE